MNEIENTAWVTLLTIAEHRFCSHVKHSPTDTVYYIMYYLKQKTPNNHSECKQFKYMYITLICTHTHTGKV